MCIDETKTEGQVFTPTDIVTMILDSVRYTGKSVLTKTIMEPSFGKGAFLIEIVSRIIHEGRAEGKSANEIKEIIEKCVYGIEKDEDLYREAIQKLNELLMAYDISLPSWSNNGSLGCCCISQLTRPLTAPLLLISVYILPLTIAFNLPSI